MLNYFKWNRKHSCTPFACKTAQMCLYLFVPAETQNRNVKTHLLETAFQKKRRDVSYELLLFVIVEENLSNICWSQPPTYEALMLYCIVTRRGGKGLRQINLQTNLTEPCCLFCNVQLYC